MTGATGAPGGIEIRHLEAFIALARRRHFGEAAAELSLSQPALSRTIAQLEDRLDRRLFDRTSTVTALTDAGHAFLPGARASIDALARAISGARRVTAAAPVLGVLNSLGFEWLAALERAIDARGDAQPELCQLAWPDGFDPLSDLVDVGIYPLPVALPEHLASITLGYRRPWIALPQTHPLAQRPEVRLSELRALPAIAEPAHDLWMRSVAMLFRAQNVEFVLGAPAISLCHVLSMIADSGGWTMAAAKGDFHLWDGVAFRPLVDVDHVRVAAVWERRRAGEERVERLVGALRVIAEREP